MSSQPKNESVVKSIQLLEAQMKNTSLMAAVLAASLAGKPYSCCYCTTVVESFATLPEATLFRDSSHILLTIVHHAPRVVPDSTTQ